MTRAALLLTTLVLCACGDTPPLPEPTILSVTPNQVLVNERSTLRVSLDAVIPVHVDYGRELASPSPVTARVWLGEVEAPDVELAPDGTLTVPVPESLRPGTYDIRVSLSDGREARRSAALTVATPNGGGPGEELFDAGILIDLDGGLASGGQRDVTGFVLEHVAPQQQGLPFQVVIRALGPRAPRFQGPVSLSINKRNGGVSPSTLGPFVNGVCADFVTVSALGANVKLTVTDDSGAQGTSNGFKVR